jgi:predicted Zn-dependent protease
VVRALPPRLALGLLLAALVGCASELSTADLAAEYYNLGNGFLELADFENAASYYERSLALAPNPQARYNLALAFVESGRPGPALAQLGLLSSDEPENVLVLELEAMALHRAGRDAEALAVYASITELQPENDVAPYNRALLLWATGQTDTASGVLRDLVERRPDDADALYNLALILTEMAELDEAASAWRGYLEGAPTDVAALLAFAEVQRNQKRYGEALETFAIAESALPAGDARVAGILFERAAILLTEVEDPRAGLASLGAAFAAGYRDRGKVAELLEEPLLLDRDRVLEIVEEHNLQPRDSAGPEPSPPAD